MNEFKPNQLLVLHLHRMRLNVSDDSKSVNSAHLAGCKDVSLSGPARHFICVSQVGIQRLNLFLTVSISELKRNYLQLSLEHHPDKNGGQTSDTFIEIDKAWKVLSDQKQRSVYDAEQANVKLESEQSAAIWRYVDLSELKLDQEDLLSLTCRCGGLYQLEQEEVAAVTSNILTLSMTEEMLSSAAWLTSWCVTGWVR